MSRDFKRNQTRKNADVYYGDPAPRHRYCELSELCAVCGDELGNHDADVDPDDGHEFTPSGRWRS